MQHNVSLKAVCRRAAEMSRNPILIAPRGGRSARPTQSLRRDDRTSGCKSAKMSLARKTVQNFI